MVSAPRAGRPLLRENHNTVIVSLSHGVSLVDVHTQVLRERATALEATVVAVESEVTVLETALFAMPEDGRHGCVPRLFLGDAAETGVIDLSEPPQPATLDTSQSDE